MAIAQWADGLATGLCELDCQHKALIKMVNVLNEVLSKNKGKEVITQAASCLLDFFGEHFQNEERIMQESDYPSHKDHKGQHDEFVRELKTLIDEFNNTGDTSLLVNKVQHFIVRWLLDHIVSYDKELADFVHAELGKKVA
ncbi:MAG: bacteriohemerythrin [Firmicutes bacterium]|nr:bacteriohemerythrin [Bacillota bacterium]